ncbi:ABC transporter permease [Halosolutus amylolyticus]|uniref:ABC transporter permease n=1 Tax=Halosolutus amylolyticus TaxID=2932267 RepID=A0ABD5PJ38_9EURY|nr:ABC transporter permease [Halosolutus amylolyticus]
MTENTDLLIRQTIQHLNVSLTAIMFATVVWIPLGIFLHYNDQVARAVLGGAGMVLTIPSLAMFPLLIPVLGIGELPAITALVLYSALPMTRNTYIGLRDIDSAMLRAGKGLGMTDRQLMLRVKLPKALPVIFAGVRHAAILVVGITTVAAFFGAGGLGRSIFRGIELYNTDQVIGATIVVALIAICIDYGLYGIQRQLPGGKQGGH